MNQRPVGRCHQPAKGSSRSYPGLMRARWHLLGLVALVAANCADGPTTPPPLPEITLENQLPRSGDLVTLRSDGFRSESALRVVIESDTIMTESGTSADERRFRLPALMTGRYRARVLTEAGEVPIWLDVIGLARDPVPVAGGFVSSIPRNVQPTGGSEAYLAEPDGSFFGIGEDGAYAVVDVFNPEKARQLSGLIEDGVNQVKMTVPGPSYRTNHLVFDFSPPGASDARVWTLSPTPGSVAPLPCGWQPPSGGFHYSVAEIAPATCLEIRHDEIWRNGSDLLVGDPGLADAQFRIGPGGERTVPLTRTGLNQPALESWPVFDAAGTIAFSSTRYDRVPGVAFSNDGATLWVTARLDDGDWTVEELDAATGEVRRSLALPELDQLLDILRHPADDRLHVASKNETTNLPALHTIDADRLERIGTVAAPSSRSCARIVFDGVLQAGGSDGRIHLLARSGFDCGWWVWSFDVTR